MARYQNGSVRIEQRSDGPTWVYRFQVTRSDGKRVEHKTVLSLVRDVGPSEKDAWQEVDRQRLRENANQYQPFPWEPKDVRAALSALHPKRVAGRSVRGNHREGIHNRRDLQADSQQESDSSFRQEVTVGN